MGQKPTGHLPRLEKGVNLLKHNGSQRALHALVINQLILSREEALWLDTGNTCSTHIISRITPEQNILEKITVARAFNPYQHHKISENLSKEINESTSLLVLPLLDHLYHKKIADKRERIKTLHSTLENIHHTTDKHDLTTIITASGASNLDFMADNVIKCRETRQGLKFKSKNFSTLTYTGPGYIQTTLKLWEILLKNAYRVREESENMVNKQNIKKEVIRAG